MATITDPTAASFGKLERGGYSGAETFVYYDARVGSYSTPPTEDPQWVLIGRATDVQFSDSYKLHDILVMFSDGIESSVGERVTTGSLRYPRRRGADTVYAYLKAEHEAKRPIYLRFLNNLLSVVGARGVEGAFVLGAFEESQADAVATRITFRRGNAFDHAGGQIGITAVEVT